MSLNVAQLIASGILSDTELVGGRRGLGRRVRTVTSCDSAHRLRTLGTDTVAVFTSEGPTIEDLDAETAIRLAGGLNLSALVFPSQEPRDALVTTRRLADKLGLPVIVCRLTSTAEAVDRLDNLARFPELATARSLQEFIRKLRHTGQSPDRLLAALTEQLSCPVALIDSHGRRVRGTTAFEASETLLEHLRQSPAVGRTIEDDTGGVTVVEPITRSQERTAHLWLAAYIESRIEARMDHARHLLAVSAWPLTAALLQRTLTGEREGRQRSMLLTEIVEHSDSLPRQTVERAAALGWQLSGWHTAVAVTSRDGGADARGSLAARVVEDGLKLHEINADLVERPEGWVFWITNELEPSTGDGVALMDRIRTALEWVNHEVPSASLAAGVGLPFEGPEGIRKSIQEAEHACLLARTSSQPVAVEHSDSTSVRRLLIGYYSNRALREVAAHLMAPLREADTAGDLERTMAAFLDNKSSATATAKALNIHRNTVLHRLERITALLKLDFTDAEDRLAAQLAVHLAELN